ncbi:MAG: hypothetical protein V4555_19195 [Acidobacteriota bacterium]
MQSVSLDTLAEQADTIESELRSGHTLQLLQGGKRIAEIVPRNDASEEEKDAAWDSFLALMNAGLELGGTPLTYDERHE